MDRLKHGNANDLIERRLDEMKLSPRDVALAKSSLRTADLIVDLGFAAGASVRSLAAILARHLKAAFVSSPQH